MLPMSRSQGLEGPFRSVFCRLLARTPVKPNPDSRRGSFSDPQIKESKMTITKKLLISTAAALAVLVLSQKGWAQG